MFLKRDVSDYTLWWILNCVSGDFDSVFDQFLPLLSKGMADKLFSALGNLAGGNIPTPSPLNIARRILGLWEDYLATASEIQKSKLDVASPNHPVSVDNEKSRFATRVAAAIDTIRRFGGEVEANEFSKRLLK